MAAFHLAELGPVDTAADGCSFLAKPKRCATIANPFAEGAGGLVESWLGLVVWHERNHIRPTWNRPERETRMLIAPMRNRIIAWMQLDGRPSAYADSKWPNADYQRSVAFGARRAG